jgi:pimeloyl-ACP methyl ester carboxylesterase
MSLRTAVTALLLCVVVRAEGSPGKPERGVVQLANGVRMAHELSPPARGTRLKLLLHGSGHDHRSWDEVARELRERGVGYLRPDLLGHGETHLRSAAALGRGYSALGLRDQARAVKELILTLGVPELEIVGLSYGAAVGVHLAADDDPALARRVRGELALINPYVARVDPHYREMMLAAGATLFDGAYRAAAESPMGRLLRENPFFAAMEPLAYQTWKGAAQLWGGALFDASLPLAVVEGRRRSIRDNHAWTKRPLAPADEAALVEGASATLMASLHDDLVRAPPPFARPLRLHLIRSDQDELVPPSFLNAFSERMRGDGHEVRETILRGAPHKVIWTHPKQVTDAITEP